MSNILDFRSNLSNRGLAKSSRFQALIGLPQGLREAGNSPLAGYDGLRYRCTDAEISGQSLNTTDARYYGPIFRTPNLAIYSDLTLMFLTQDNMMERSFFYDWFRYIHGNGSYDFNFRDEYAAPITVEKLSEVDNKVMLTMNIRNAYPVNILPIPMSWADDGFIRTSIQFAYTEFNITME